VSFFAKKLCEPQKVVKKENVQMAYTTQKKKQAGKVEAKKKVSNRQESKCAEEKEGGE